ncbi:MAG: DUF3501 family protein [Candidatus Dormibacteraeota bacterium]|uniref:DUF3501 family protein n=1 Tax=Candidatus Amunia macphersoniae TaxID=3127014 RepID=A0A934KMV1_9BACT|nr:DUF3501 family protein [Candidatus Dormibacteraeota bacterium]
MEPLLPRVVRTGADYETERAASRLRLAEAGEDRRVDLGGGLVLVFETAETVLSALEEWLRAERVDDPDRIAAEATAFSALLAGEQALGATLYVDDADPAGLADRVAELEAVGAAVSLVIAGRRITARSDAEDVGAGAMPLAFPLDQWERRALLGGATVEVVVDHPRHRASVALRAEQLPAISVDVER